jgi:hypothetical protein
MENIRVLIYVPLKQKEKMKMFNKINTADRYAPADFFVDRRARY